MWIYEDARLLLEQIAFMRIRSESRKTDVSCNLWDIGGIAS